MLVVLLEEVVVLPLLCVDFVALAFELEFEALLVPQFEVAFDVAFEVEPEVDFVADFVAFSALFVVLLALWFLDVDLFIFNTSIYLYY